MSFYNCITNLYSIARDETRGKEAVQELEKEGLHPHFHQLDIENTDSVEQLRKFLADKYGGLDILVNNAGMAYKVSSLKQNFHKILLDQSFSTSLIVLKSNR